MLPAVRLVAVLRDPVERLHAHYAMNRQVDLEPLGLAEAVEAEPFRRLAGWGCDWHYVGLGLCARQVQRYQALFGEEQLAVVLHEEWRNDPAGVMARICRHVGIEPAAVPPEGEAREDWLPRSQAVARWTAWPNPLRERLARVAPARTERALARIRRWNRAPVPPLDPALRHRLAPLFHEDGAALARLLRRPVPWAPAESAPAVARPDVVEA